MYFAFLRICALGNCLRTMSFNLDQLQDCTNIFIVRQLPLSLAFQFNEVSWLRQTITNHLRLVRSNRPIKSLLDSKYARETITSLGGGTSRQLFFFSSFFFFPRRCIGLAYDCFALNSKITVAATLQAGRWLGRSVFLSPALKWLPAISFKPYFLFTGTDVETVNHF